MNCTQCETLTTLPKGGGNLIISCDVPEMASKIIIYLNQNSIHYEADDPQTLSAYVPMFTPFLQHLCNTKTFSEMERKAIRILCLEDGESLTPSKLRMMKTLQQYQNIASAEYLAALIIEGGLTTYFQPIVDISTNIIYGYESLVRGINQDGTLISPNELFQWGRDGDMLFYLDRACRENALKTAALKKITSKIFINFIPTAIYDPEHCLQTTVEWAKQLEFDPKNIIFEVIESDHVEDIEHLKRILDYYKSQGFMVALDDVGSGYSSLNRISKLRPDIIKIDRAIIDNIDTNSMNQSIFKAIVTIAKENDILVLSEGIERIEEATYCAKVGSELAQGYYYAKPNSEPINKLS